MKIEMPGIAEQQAYVMKEATREAIARLQANLDAPRLPPQTLVDETQYSRAHLMREEDGWEAPDADLVKAYFDHFQEHFPAYSTDKRLADLLGLKSGDRRVRAFKEGSRKVPYGVWRRFLVITGRVPQEVLPVMAFMG